MTAKSNPISLGATGAICGGVLLPDRESRCVGDLGVARGKGDRSGLPDAVEAGRGVEIVDLGGRESVGGALRDARADDGEDAGAGGRGGRVEDAFVGPVRVGDEVTCGVAEEQVRVVAGPRVTLIGLCLEAVHVTDRVRAAGAG